MDRNRHPRFEPPTYAEALASTQEELATARSRLTDAAHRLRRARKYGRDPRAALLAWNLANNEVEHRERQVEWWRGQLDERPDLAEVPILRVTTEARSTGNPPNGHNVAPGPSGETSWVEPCDPRAPKA